MCIAILKGEVWSDEKKSWTSIYQEALDTRTDFKRRHDDDDVDVV